MSFFSKLSSAVTHAADQVAHHPAAAGALAKANTTSTSAIFNELGLEKVIAGLKEALVVAVRQAIAVTGKQDGFLANQLIKITMPHEAQAVASGLRSIGMGSVVDNFETSMNRAAESAAPLATDVFVSAITDMTFEDAKSIWKGKEQAAASKYLERVCTPKLKEAFAPKIQEAMEANSVTRTYEKVVKKAKPLPFVGDKLAGFDLEEWTLTKALQGIFVVMGQEEEKIRADPAHRVTDLLQEVFKR